MSRPSGLMPPDKYSTTSPGKVTTETDWFGLAIPTLTISRPWMA